jgi:ketosteroid isomerase-like protein
MGQRPVDTVRGIYDEWARGNFREGFDLHDEHLVFVDGVGPEGGPRYGREALADFMRQFLRAWAKATITAEELLEAGDTVGVAVRQRTVGVGSGIETEMNYWQVWTFRAGKVIRFENFKVRDAALEAMGLDATEVASSRPSVR